MLALHEFNHLEAVGASIIKSYYLPEELCPETCCSEMYAREIFVHIIFDNKDYNKEGRCTLLHKLYIVCNVACMKCSHPLSYHLVDVVQVTNNRAQYHYLTDIRYEGLQCWNFSLPPHLKALGTTGDTLLPSRSNPSWAGMSLPPWAGFGGSLH